MAVTGAWWFGARPSMPAQTWSVTSNSVTEDIVIPAGSYYLDDSSSSRSLVSVVETALNGHSQITNTVSCFLARDRLVRITDDNPIDITFTNTDARDILGFTGNLSGTGAYEAQNVSDFLWVPDRPADPDARLGRDGDTVDDTVFSSSAGTEATLVATQWDERTWNTFRVDHIPNAYGDPGTDVGGTYRTFWHEVLRRFRNIAIYDSTLHDETSDTAVGLLASNRHGPYRWRPPGGPVRYELPRVIPNVHRLHRVSIDVVQTAEYP